MPSEPDNKMDDLLKTYAKKRRDEAGAPLEMHPATRRMLQAETAKLRPMAVPTSTSWFDTLRIFWPRVAFAAGILLVAGIAAITFLPTANEKQEKMQFAKQDAAPTGKPERESVLALEDKISAPAPARREIKALPELALAEEKQMEKKLKTLDVVQNELLNNVALNRAATAAPAASAAPASEPVALGAVAAQSADKTGGVAGGPPASTVADFKQTDVLARSLKEGKPLAQEQFYKAAARSRFANAQPVSGEKLRKETTAYDATVLVNFVVEQDGDQLRVVDADGSVYDGKVLFGEPPATGFETQVKIAAESRRDAAKPALAQAGKDLRAQQPLDEPVAPASWNFRVSGTNRTLQQPVIVDGILFETAATNSPNQAGAKVASEPLQLYRFTPAQNSAASSLNQSYNGQSMNLLNTRRIQGSIRVGATNQLPLDAVPDGNQR